MVPSKLPEIHSRPALPIRFVILLLVGSIILNIGLWRSLVEQGQDIYNKVAEIVPALTPAEPEQEPEQEPDTLDAALDAQELACMATNIYHESARESDLGKIAVAMVVLNRVSSPDFPDTICDVVHQPSRDSTRPRSCQFSWTCDGKSDRIRDSEKYQSIISLSRDILRSRDTIVDIVDGALYYHAVYVNPSWAKYFKRVTRIDTHIFYKNKP